MKKRRIKCLIIICIILCAIPNFYFFKYLFAAEKYQMKKKQFSDDFVVMSYNIRCWTILDIGKKSWFYRADLIIDNVSAVEPDIVGFQEVTSGQYLYLKNNLQGYNSIISYRDSAPWSEGCPIFFNADRYELVETQTFWLSDTPDKISKGWDAADYRICSFVVLWDKKTEKKLAVFNTHLDHKSEEARVKGMEVIANRIAQSENIPIILLGDFNSTEDMDAYTYITNILSDAKYETDSSMPGNTYHNWGKQLEGGAIDYILASKDKFCIIEYAIFQKSYNGVFPSDHFPIYVKMNFQDV